MILQKEIDINEKGHMTFEGADVTDLAKDFGTPLYVMSEKKIRENMRTYKKAFDDHLGGRGITAYASKAFSCKKIYEIAKEEGIYTDVVSSGEMYTAFKAGFDMKKVFFHGNCKTAADIALALDLGVGYIVCDSREEIELLDSIAGEKGVVQDILLRVTPGIDPHTFEAVATGKIDSKFGTPIATGGAKRMTEKILSLGNIRLRGFHCHVGSQCFDSKVFFDAADIMIDFISDISGSLGYIAEILNLGGGYGVRYVESDPIIDIADNIRTVAEHIYERCAKKEIPVPVIALEPGRSIVADAGITLYTCGGVKRIEGYRNYVAIDGGMADDPRFALYGSRYTVINATKAGGEKDLVADIAGRCCESGDMIARDVKIATPEAGDIIAVPVTGAYNYSMASNYNRLPRPAVVMIRENGGAEVIVRRESLDDLIKNDM